MKIKKAEKQYTATMCLILIICLVLVDCHKFYFKLMRIVVSYV